MKRAVLLLFGLAVGCGIEPILFTVPRFAKLPPLEIIEQSLRNAGLVVVARDPRNETLTTDWQDTGVVVGRIANTPATLMRRCVVSTGMSQHRVGIDVSVRVEGKRCALRTCEPLPPKFARQLQRERDAIGKRLGH